MTESNEVQGGDDRSDRALPPYEGRRESADVSGEGEDAVHNDGANVGGATGPAESSDMKSAPKEDTPRGAEASPSDEQPVGETSGSTPNPDQGVGPAHTAGTGRAENKSQDER